MWITSENHTSTTPSLCAHVHTTDQSVSQLSCVQFFSTAKSGNSSNLDNTWHIVNINIQRHSCLTRWVSRIWFKSSCLLCCSDLEGTSSLQIRSLRVMCGWRFTTPRGCGKFSSSRTHTRRVGVATFAQSLFLWKTSWSGSVSGGRSNYHGEHKCGKNVINCWEREETAEKLFYFHTW